MDVNATLDNMRAALRSLETRQASDPDHLQALGEIAECAAALDHHLSWGGFLPNSWADVNDQH